MQFVICQLLHQELPGGGRADSDGHIGLAAAEVDHPRQRHDLDIQIRVLFADLGADLGQNVIGAAIGRANTDLPRQGVAWPGQRLSPGPHCLFGGFSMDQQAVPRRAQRIALRGFHEQRRL